MSREIVWVAALLCWGNLEATAMEPTYYPSVDAVCKAFPAKTLGLLDALDLTRPGLESVKQKAQAGDVAGACEALIAYYDRQDLRQRALQIGWPVNASNSADPALLFAHTFPYKNWTYSIPLRADGGWDWTYCGPTGKDLEFGWSINRHFHLFLALKTYMETKDARYFDFAEKNLQDWLVALPPYPAALNNTPQWRGLEVAIRLNGWPLAFYGLQGKPLSPATRLLMLMTIPDHAHYNRDFHAKHGNWGTIEMDGLSSAALAWPEFRESDAWWDKVISEVELLQQDQVYPDGVQNELTSNYHFVVAQRLLYVLLRAQIAGRAIPADFKSRVESMWDYGVRSLGPDLVAPQNSDSDFRNWTTQIEQALSLYDRPDWRYVITYGKTGEKPAGPLSSFYPWAGHAIMRDGWDKNAQWAFFDMGPLGAGHFHFDKLHLSIRAGGRELLLDSGRYNYLDDPFRAYVVSTRAHNTLSVDGNGQKPFEKIAQRPIVDQHRILKDYDYFRGDFEDGYENVEGEARHTRAVVYVRGAYWVVVDRVETDRPRRIEAFWHFGQDCTVGFEGVDALTFDPGEENLRISPVGDFEWQLSLVRGQREPQYQGWYSPSNNLIIPAPAVVYATSVPETSVFIWTLTPGRNKAPRVETTVLSKSPQGVTLEIRFKDRRDRLTIPLKGAAEAFEGARLK